MVIINHDQEQQRENIRLAETLAQISAQLAVSEQACAATQTKLKHTLLNYWEDCGG